MTQQPVPTPDDAGRMYDQITDFSAQVLGGNIHLGYWNEGGEGTPVTEATDRLTDMVAERLAPQPTQRLLDIGCGTGRPALRIASRYGVHVTGITVSAHQLEQAQAAVRDEDAADRVGFQHADAMRLPFSAESFDAAWAIESLLHMSDQPAALTEAARVVRPGGRLVVADLCLREPVTGKAKATMDGMLQLFQITSFTAPDQYRQYLRQAGWKLRELIDIGERVRASYGHITSAMRRLTATPDGPLPAQFPAGVDLIDAFGACPQLGYLLITAERPASAAPAAEFNSCVAADERVDSVVLPRHDGMTLIRHATNAARSR